MNFDKAYVIGSYDFSTKRLKRFYHMSNSMNINVELWPAIYGLDVDVNEYKTNGVLYVANRPHITGMGREFFAQITMKNNLIHSVK